MIHLTIQSPHMVQVRRPSCPSDKLLYYGVNQNKRIGIVVFYCTRRGAVVPWCLLWIQTLLFETSHCSQGTVRIFSSDICVITTLLVGGSFCLKQCLRDEIFPSNFGRQTGRQALKKRPRLSDCSRLASGDHLSQQAFLHVDCNMTIDTGEPLALTMRACCGRWQMDPVLQMLQIF